MKLGVAYNVFDGEELLEKSLLSIRPCVDYVCIVYQTKSNFGKGCADGLVDLLNSLVEKQLVDDLVHYTPRTFSPEEKRALTSTHASLNGSVGETIANIADQFLNELTKREVVCFVRIPVAHPCLAITRTKARIPAQKEEVEGVRGCVNKSRDDSHFRCYSMLVRVTIVPLECGLVDEHEARQGNSIVVVGLHLCSPKGAILRRSSHELSPSSTSCARGCYIWDGLATTGVCWGKR